MKWIVTIENKSNLRIIVRYLALENKVIFVGEYGIKKDLQTTYHSFVCIEKNTDIILDEILDTLFKVYTELSDKVKLYDEFSKEFEVIKTIEIPDD